MSVYIVTDRVYSVKRRDVLPSQISYALSDGNLKYHGNETTSFLIWSIVQGQTCIGATDHCKNGCYALKAWLQYANVRLSRRENLRACYSPTFVDDMTAIIRYKLKYLPKGKTRLITRIHEAGDFFADWYAQAWMQIADNVSDDPRALFWTYSKSFDFFDGVTFPDPFKFRASVWDDTPQRDLEIIERNHWPIYTAVDRFDENDTSYAKCRCEDCATCETPCGDTSILKTCCEIH